MIAIYAPKKNGVRWLKILGGATILLSFVTQNFLYDRWDSQRSALRAAIDERATIDKSVLLNEILYFTARLPSGNSNEEDKVRRFKIHEAARKMAMSSMMPVLYSNSLTIREKAALTDRLFVEAASVGDYESYLKLIQVINNDYGKYSAAITKQDQHLGAVREKAQWVYLGLYLLGSCVLLGTVKYE